MHSAALLSRPEGLARRSIAISREAEAINARLETRPGPAALLPAVDRLILAPANPSGRANRKARRAIAVPTGERKFAPPKSLEVRLVENLVHLKSITSQVAMHLDDQWRVGLNRQLEFLLDPTEWPEDAALPDPQTYAAFLRLVLLLRPKKRPSFGVSDFGSFLASWEAEGDRAHLFVEFHSGNSVRWSASQLVDGRLEVTSGQTVIERLGAHLPAYHPERWFERLELV